MPQPAWVKGRLQTEPYLSRLFYGVILKRSSTYMTAVMVVATTIGIGYDYAMDGVWNSVNKGKLWKDIKDSCALASEARHPVRHFCYRRRLIANHTARPRISTQTRRRSKCVFSSCAA